MILLVLHQGQFALKSCCRTRLVQLATSTIGIDVYNKSVLQKTIPTIRLAYSTQPFALQRRSDCVTTRSSNTTNIRTLTTTRAVEYDVDFDGGDENNKNGSNSSISSIYDYDEGTITNGIRLSRLICQYGGNVRFEQSSRRNVSNNRTKPLPLQTMMSRREAERIIKSGNVTISGKVVTTPWTLLTQEQYMKDEITLYGIPLRVKDITNNKLNDRDGPIIRTNMSSTIDAIIPESSSTKQLQVPTVWIVHKLKGELVTENDPHNRPSLLERLRRAGIQRRLATASRSNGSSTTITNKLNPIGRLDMNTEGLILLTNCTTYKRQMELPKNKIQRVYRVRVHGLITQQKIDGIQNGTVRVNLTTNRNQKQKLITTTNKKHAIAIPNKSKPNRRRRKGSSTPTVPVNIVTKTVRYGPMKVTLDRDGLNDDNNYDKRRDRRSIKNSTSSSNSTTSTTTTKSSTTTRRGGRQQRTSGGRSSSLSSSSSSFTSSTNQWVQVTCCEGKNRQIRNVFQALGLTVTRLIRISFGDYHLQTIPPGMAVEVPYKSMEHQKNKGPLFVVQQQHGIKKNQQPMTRINYINNQRNQLEQKEQPTEAKASPIQWIRTMS